jgi:hypothetical protein
MPTIPGRPRLRARRIRVSAGRFRPAGSQCPADRALLYRPAASDRDPANGNRTAQTGASSGYGCAGKTCSARPRACSAKGAEGLAGLLENILKDQGEPVAYIAGREAGGAFIAGVKYGSGTMRHEVEGERAVFWTGPSVGFDWGADASKVFVLVYNLHDTADLFKRYPAAEGRAYALGGFTASYLRRGKVVLIPVRLGVGLRLGANVGYMRFSEKTRWSPF